MAFRWRLILAHLYPPSLHQLKENIVKVGPPLTKLSGSAHVNEGQKYCRMLPLEHSAILLTGIK